MDQLKNMEVFLAIADAKSLTAAAAHLKISRSMVTRSLAALEENWQVKLFHRSTRSLGLTSLGKELLPYCRQILILNNNLLNHALEHNSNRLGTIRVTCSSSLSQVYLSNAIERFMQTYPKVVVEIYVDATPIRLLNNQCDIAIQVTNRLPEHLIARRITNCQSIICGSPSYIEQYGAPINALQLADHNCLLNQKQGKIWPIIDPKTHQMINIEVSGNLQSNDTSLLVDWALNGRGIAYLPLAVINDYLHQGKLQQLLPEYQLEDIGIWAVYCSRDYRPLIQQIFLDFLIADMRME